MRSTGVNLLFLLFVTITIERQDDATEKMPIIDSHVMHAVRSAVSKYISQIPTYTYKQAVKKGKKGIDNGELVGGVFRRVKL